MRLASALLIVLALPLAAGCSARQAASARAEYLTPYGPPTRPLTPAVRVGNVLYLSGRLGTGADGKLVAGGITGETRQTMENIKDVLEKTGSGIDRVVKCTVFMADMAEWDAMNAVYATYFPTHKPARTAVGVSGLALGARVEIECLATVG